MQRHPFGVEYLVLTISIKVNCGLGRYWPELLPPKMCAVLVMQVHGIVLRANNDSCTLLSSCDTQVGKGMILNLRLPHLPSLAVETEQALVLHSHEKIAIEFG